jgi:hypothetical protein
LIFSSQLEPFSRFVHRKCQQDNHAIDQPIGSHCHNAILLFTNIADGLPLDIIATSVFEQQKYSLSDRGIP